MSIILFSLLKSTLNDMKRNLSKSILTIATVGLGVGVLIFSLSISGFFENIVEKKLSENGFVLTVSNSSYNDEGVLEPERPSQFDEQVIEILQQSVPGAESAAALSGYMMNSFRIGDNIYGFRNVMTVSEQYADVMDLKMVIGRFITAHDVADGANVAVISQGVAEQFYGSAEAALGQELRAPLTDEMAAFAGTRGGRSFTLPAIEIVGVYAEIDELKRKAYWIADVVLPLTSNMFSQGNNRMANYRYLYNTVVMNIQGQSKATAEAAIYATLTAVYGDDLVLEIWEGTPSGDDALLDEVRGTISTFSLVVNILGFILLITGSIGILSIMLIEVIGKTREIALERAIGAAKGNIIAEFLARSVIISALSVITGIILSIVFSKPLQDLILPIFNGIMEIESTSGIISVPAVLISSATALAVGGFFGIIPVVFSLKAPIAEGLRES